MNPTPTTGVRSLEPALTWVGRAGSTAAQAEPCNLPKRNRRAWTTWVAPMAMGFGAHPPTIALAAHGSPDPVEMSDLPHPAPGFTS